MYNLLEDTDYRYRNDPRCPLYNPRKHGYLAECDYCGQDIYRDEEYLYADGEIFCERCAELFQKREEDDYDNAIHGAD